MSDSLNKALARIVDDIGSVNHDKIKALLATINTRNLSGVDCTPWHFFFQVGSSEDGPFVMTNDLFAFDGFNPFLFFDSSFSFSDCIVAGEYTELPAGFATDLNYTVVFTYPSPFVGVFVDTFTFSVALPITNQASLDAWYAALISAMELQGVIWQLFIGDPSTGFGPAYIPDGPPDHFTIYCVNGISFEITGDPSTDSVVMLPQDPAECRYDVEFPGSYQLPGSNLYVGRLEVLVKQDDGGAQVVASIRDYLSLSKGITILYGGTPSFGLNSQVAVCGGNAGTAFLVQYTFEDIIFTKIAVGSLDYNEMSSSVWGLNSVNFYGYKIGPL